MFAYHGILLATFDGHRMIRTGLFFNVEDTKNPQDSLKLSLTLFECDALVRTWPELVLAANDLARAWMVCSRCQVSIEPGAKAPELDHGVDKCGRTKKYWTRGAIVEWPQGLVVTYGDVRIILSITTSKQAAVLKNALKELRCALDWFLAANPKVIWTCRLTIGRANERFYKYFEDTIQPTIDANPAIGQVVRTTDTLQGKVVQFVFDANLLDTDEILRQSVYNVMLEQMNSNEINNITLKFTPTSTDLAPDGAPIPLKMQMTGATSSTYIATEK